MEALKERYLRHVKTPVRPQGERTMQLSIIRKDSTPAGQEELHTESVSVTVKEAAEEPAVTIPGMRAHPNTTNRSCLAAPTQSTEELDA